MSRLFYEPVPTDRAKLAGRQDNNTKKYLEKVSKIVPAEIVAGYVAMLELVSMIRNKDLHNKFYIGIFLLCAILTPLYTYYQAEKDKPYVMHIIMTTLSFCVWAFAVSGKQWFADAHEPAIASILLVAFTLVSGFIPLRK